MDTSKLQFGLNYIETDSVVHRLNGVTKLVLFLCWVTMALTSFDLRLLCGLLLCGFLILHLSKIPFRVYKPFFLFMLYLLVINALFMFLFSPLQGVVYMKSKTVLFTLSNRYVVTQETLFYLLVIVVKYFSIFPVALVFVFATHPTEFAASLNKIGIPYKVAYIVSLTLRYLPEITKDFVNIMHAQQARGIDISKKVSLWRRIVNVSKVLIPLLLSSLDKADVIANAMTLRGFGKKKKRTWYNEKALQISDVFLLVGIAIFVAFFAYMRLRADSLFWYPFFRG